MSSLLFKRQNLYSLSWVVECRYNVYRIIHMITVGHCQCPIQEEKKSVDVKIFLLTKMLREKILIIF